MADTATPDVSDAGAAAQAAPVYKHTLSGHAVQGDATFREINDHDRPYEGGAEGAMNLPDIHVFAEAAGMKEKEKEDTKPLEPLPEIPGMPMTVEQAYDCARLSQASAAAARARPVGTHPPCALSRADAARADAARADAARVRARQSSV